MRRKLRECENTERGGKRHLIGPWTDKMKREGTWMGLQRGAIFGVVWSQVESKEMTVEQAPNNRTG